MQGFSSHLRNSIALQLLEMKAARELPLFIGWAAQKTAASSKTAANGSSPGAARKYLVNSRYIYVLNFLSHFKEWG